MPTKAQRATAYHEAGHAVLSLLMRHHIRRVSIVPNDDEGTLGHCSSNGAPKWFKPDVGMGFRDEKWIESEVLILLAGTAAARHLTGRHNWRGSNRDIAAACDLASYLYHGRALKLFLAFMIERTRTAVASPATWLQIEAVAEALLDRGTLSGREVRTVCQQAIMSRAARLTL